MKISLDFLKNFVNFSEKNPQKIAEILTERSAEIDAFENFSEKFNEIFVGEILEILPHPNADKIQITKTNVGDETLQILCGAKNIFVGAKVFVAKIGAVLPGNFKIEKREIRGENSFGMICSAAEIGVETKSDGVWILPKNSKVGAKFTEFFEIENGIFEVDNTAITNRADLFSHLGFAREIVANNLGKWKISPQKFFEKLEKFAEKFEKLPAPKLQTSFENADEICPAYAAVEIENFKIAESPPEIAGKLIAAGIRPINNLVDVTNFVMLELGIPTHAFDRDKIGAELNFRISKNGEKLQTLDDKIHELPLDAIVAENEKRELVDLCGIMGAKNSAIDANSTNIFLHAPIYDAVKIRRAALKLNHRTDAATIYEKSVAPFLAFFGAARAAELILQICPTAKISSRILKIANSAEKNFAREKSKATFQNVALEKKFEGDIR